MSNIDRRRVTTGLGGLSATLLSTTALGQTGLSQDQKSAYAKVFASAPRVGAATSPELKTLRAIQETQKRLPSSIAALREAIEKGPAIQAMQTVATPQLGMLLFWHRIALDATAQDHTTESPANPPPTYGEQLGPTRSSRALAIIHLAMFEAVNVIFRKAHSYKDIQKSIVEALAIPIDTINATTASVPAAITESAYGTLKGLYPNKVAIFDIARQKALVMIGDSDPIKQLGAAIGQQAAAAVLKLRRLDGWDRDDLLADSFNTANPISWKKDPVVPLKPALGGNWPKVEPFVLQKAEQFRPEPPPRIGDPKFVDAYKSVKRLGGDPKAPSVNPRWPTPTDRTGTDAISPLDATNETFKGIFWAYDGTPSLCAPPRLYNMVATSIALNEKPITKVEEFARFLALINIAMADAGIGAWEAKYYYLYARPITALRSVDADMTPQGKASPKWTPLGAPVSNGGAGSRNLTPPFPAYPSGHATFGGALFEVMRKYWGLPVQGVAFDFVSDEFNGENRGPGEEQPRPLVRRQFTTFEEAEKENAQSRIWLGIHWQFDADAGIKQGREIGGYIAVNALQPIP